MSLGQRLLGLSTCLYLALCVLLGGASAAGIVGNAVLQLLGLVLIVGAVAALAREGLARRMVFPLLLMGAILLLGAIQLVPLPASVWTGFAGRGTIVEGYRMLGMELPNLPISLTPERTLRSLLWLIPAAAMLLATLALGPAWRVRLLYVLIGLALVSLLVGLAQLTGASGAYFYELTNRGSAVGFFANRNHLATFLLAAIAAAPAVAAEWAARGSARAAAPHRLLWIAAVVVLACGVAATQSRAGLALLFPAALFSFAVLRRTRSGLVPWRALLGTAALTVGAIALVMLGPGADRIAAKTGSLFTHESRIQAAPIVAEAARAHFPLGSGIGSFDPVYRAAAGPDDVSPYIVNHAHNDYLELWLEAGLPGLVLIALFLVWYGRNLPKIWRERDAVGGAAERAASVIVFLVLAHSLVDYPLRTAAMSAVFAMACAMMVRNKAAAVTLRAAEPRGTSFVEVGRTQEPIFPADDVLGADRGAAPASRPEVLPDPSFRRRR